jgi:hypothetical protein
LRCAGLAWSTSRDSITCMFGGSRDSHHSQRHVVLGFSAWRLRTIWKTVWLRELRAL